MTQSRRFFPALLLGPVLACGNGTGQIGIMSPPVSVSGVVRDYFFTTTLLAGAALTADDHPALTATSAANGSYTFAAVSSASTLRVVAGGTNYRSTRNETLTIGSSSVVSDVYAVATADVVRQYANVGLPLTINTGVVVVNLRDAMGQARIGIPIADIVLFNVAQLSDGRGPFVFGAGGDVVPQTTLSVSTAFGGRSRVAFLDVPPGSYTLAVTVAGPETLNVNVIVTANGVTLVQR